MSVPNQISHRANYKAQKEAGQVAVNPKPGQPPAAAPPQFPKRKKGEKTTLREKLGMAPVAPTTVPDEAESEAPAAPKLAAPKTPVEEIIEEENEKFFATARELAEDPEPEADEYDPEDPENAEGDDNTIEVDPPQDDGEEEAVAQEQGIGKLPSFDLGSPASEPEEKPLI